MGSGIDESCWLEKRRMEKAYENKGQVVYKVRHIPTGLFYQPVIGRWKDTKSNLSLTGKVYQSKKYPKDLHTGRVNVSKSLKDKFNLILRDTNSGNYLTSVEKDWEIVVYKLVEQ